MTTLPDGRKIPEIGFGTYLIPTVETRDAVYSALETGYRLIDTAACYFNEEQTAEAIADFIAANKGVKREDIIYTSKLWQDDFDQPEIGVASSVKFAERIGAIDLYLLHSPEGGKLGRRKAWKGLEDAVEQGKVKSIGVSNWSDKHLKELLEWEDLRIKPLVNQIELNPWFQQTHIVSFCHKNGIAVEAYSPLTLGLRLDHPQVQALAKKHSKTPAQILLRYAIDKKTIPLPKSIKPARIRENFEVVNFKLSDEDLANLGNPTERFVTVPSWDPVKWD